MPRSARSCLALLALASLTLVACKPKGPELPTCSDDGTSISFTEAPTWSESVAPLVNAHCVSCHQRDGSAPMSFATYDEAAPYADLMAAATADRRMPPAQPTSCGECQTFSNSHWLTPQDLATFRAWAEAGAPVGDPSSSQPPPDLPALDRVDMTLPMAEPYLPAGVNGDDDYRCFVVTPDLPETQYLTGFSVVPGQPSLVHHVILYGLYTTEQRELAQQKAGEDDKPGFPCFGDSGIDDAPMLAAWAPGVPPVEYPEGTGVRLLPGMELVLQVHYHTEFEVQPDQSAMELRLEDSVPEEAVILPVGAWDFSLEPGQAAATTWENTGDLVGPVGPVQIHAVAPHMHKRGLSMQVEMWEGLHAYACMLDLPKWDFDWQGLYFYEEPVTLPGASSVRVTCTFDTTGAESNVEWGDGTEDEMCLALFYVTGIPQNILDSEYSALE